MGHKVRLWFILIRIPTWAICVALCGYVVPLFDDLRKHPLPGDIPYLHEIVTSQGLNAVFGILAAIWLPISMFLNGFTSQKRGGYWFILYSLIDIIITGGLLDGLAATPLYLPASFATCREAETWQAVGNTSLFHCINNAYGWSGDWYSSPEGTCHLLLNARILTIVIAIIMGLTAYHPISSSRIPWPIIWVTGQVARRIKVAFEYSSRSDEHPPANTIQSEFTIGQTFKLQPRCRKPIASLDEFFTYDATSNIITLIAEKLHYSDIVSLSLTSKSMHSAIFPRSSHNARLQLLRTVSCNSGSKAECWCCGIVICNNCTAFQSLLDPVSTTHLDHCEPYCSTCYYKGPCRRWVSGRERQSKYASRCACIGRSPDYTPAWGQLLSNVPVERSICRLCASLDTTAALAVRESREKAEIMSLAKQQWRCVLCGRALRRGGPRWWGCSLCRKECVSDFHPIWAQSKKIV